MSTAQLKREICLRAQRAGRTARPSDRGAFARLLGIDPDGWQERLLRSDASRVLLLCSRQAGKSTMAALIGLHRALTPRRPSPHPRTRRAPGQRDVRWGLVCSTGCWDIRPRQTVSASWAWS